MKRSTLSARTAKGKAGKARGLSKF